MTPVTQALLREAAERGRFDHTAECSWHWRMDSACSCNAASIKARLRAAADAGPLTEATLDGIADAASRAVRSAAADAGEGEDTKRLDWLERTRHAVMPPLTEDEVGPRFRKAHDDLWHVPPNAPGDKWAEAATVRAAIDAAREVPDVG